jgi:uncharacterized membrane protein YeaQ/YmgE (transglycosylase-associated protein family)
VGLLSWIIVGLIAGWLAERITGSNHGLLTNIGVGIVGAILGGFLFQSVLGFSYARGVSLGSIVVATVGAVLFLYLLGWARGRRSL